MVGSNPIGNMVIKLSLDDADFGKGVANSKKQIQYLSKEMQANTKIADLADNTIGKLGAQHTGLSKIIEAQEKQVNALKVAYDESFVDGKPTESTKRLATQLQDANGKLANYKLQLNATEKAMMMYSQEAENAEKNIAFLTKEMDLNAQMASLSGKNSQVLAANYDGLSKIIVEQANHVNALAQAYDNSFVDGKPTEATKELSLKLKESQIELAKTAGAVAELEVKTQGLTGGIYKASETMISAGDKMASVGGKMTKSLTVPIAGAVAAVTAAAMSWESDFAGVMKTNDEVVDSTGKVIYSYDELEAGLRGLTNTYHSSHSKIAGVAEAAGQLGIETQNVVDFTETMIMLGETTVFSAEDASFALARLANITGMPQTEFRNLGSSLVELGNNFAATEAEIGNMAMNLAAAGTQVGMTEGEILGFAAALSSVGIEAQAGGTAFSKVMIEMQLATETGIGAFDELKAHAEDQGVSWEQLTVAVRNGGKELTDVANQMGFTSAELRQMYKEADKSKTSLEEFAEVAGMTNEQLAQMFKENPAEAIMEFVVGLSKAEEQGSSTIKILDDMGISEVRLRDALLRGANASDLFSDSIRMGNQAYSEGTALSDEYAIRQETTAHKLGVLKNQAKDVAITLGGPFLDALNSGIEGAKPLIEKIGELAQAFADADPKTQQTIVTLLGFTAVAGPLLAVTGKLTSSVGGLGKSFVDLMANMKKKSAIDAATAAFEAGDISASDFMVTLLTGKTTVSQFGGAASTAAGAKGVGAMTGALGTLSPVLWGVVGVGGALAVGYGAWKLFGEEAWNSSQRVQTWGTDVGAVTHETLSAVKNDTEAVAGQFGMMAEGFEVDSVKMVESVESIGRTIEDSLTRKVEGLTSLLEGLPDTFDAAMRGMLEDEIKMSEEALQTVQKNTQRISEIKATAAKHDRDLSISESKIIQDLARDTTRVYVETLDVSAEEKSKILEAMNADVENATKEQSKAWLQALGEQRRAAAENSTELRKDMEKNLEALGYNLEGEFAQKFLGAWDEINQTTVDGFDAQMAIIMEKYPELMNEVFMANGQTIDASTEAGKAMIANNEAILENATKLSRRLAKNAAENAERLTWEASQANTHLQKGAEIWNKLVFDEKTGEVKSNVNEVIIEATKDAQTWNDMKLLIHDAELDSNAKLIIGEAAIANGWWEGMAWGDKEIIINDEASYAVIEALETTGLWQEMEVDEKTAILYSNTPETMRETLISLGLWDKLEWDKKSALLESNSTETMIRTLEDNEKWQELTWEEQLLIANSNTHETLAEAMLNLGLWDEYLPHIKELEADNFEFLSILSQSEEKLTSWNSVPDSIKKILGENDDFLTTIYESDEVFARWKDVSDSEKIILANNIEFMERVLQSEEEWNRWSSLSDSEKRILGENSHLLAKVFESEESFNAWNALPTEVKAMLGNNEDILSKVRDGTISVEDYNKNVLPSLKTLFGENLDLLNTVRDATESITNYNQRIDIDSKTARGVNEVTSPVKAAIDSINGFLSFDPVMTRTVRVKSEIFGPTQAATGLNYHKGGPLLVNDQIGPLYKELVEYPDGTSFIPEGRNVMLDAPRGTKVHRASITDSKLGKIGVPDYAREMSVPANSTLVRNLRSINTSSEQRFAPTGVRDLHDYSDKLDQLIAIMSGFGRDLRNMKFEVNRRAIGDVIIEESNRRDRTQSRGKGMRG